MHQVYGLQYVAARALAIIHNFVLNDLWTFRGHVGGRVALVWSQFARFQTVSLGEMLINLGIGRGSRDLAPREGRS